MSKTASVQVCIRVTKDAYDKLLATSQETEFSVSSLVRLAILQYLAASQSD